MRRLPGLFALALLLCSVGACTAKPTTTSQGAPTRIDAPAPSSSAPQPPPVVAPALPDPPVRVVSDISKCLTVGLGALTPEGDVLIADLTLTMTKTIGSCGCRSAFLRYRAVETQPDPDVELANGTLRSPPTVGSPIQERAVVIADRTTKRHGAVTIRIGCAPPE